MWQVGDVVSLLFATLRYDNKPAKVQHFLASCEAPIEDPGFFSSLNRDSVWMSVSPPDPTTPMAEEAAVGTTLALQPFVKTRPTTRPMLCRCASAVFGCASKLWPCCC